METLAFGRTGHRSSRVIFGAAALGAMRQEKADQILELLLAYGRQPHRHRGVVRRLRAARRARGWSATATGSSWRRRPATAPPTGARASLRRSLERLRVDAGRPDPAPQPGRRARVGDGARSGRRARGAGRGARPRAGALHRRHGARHARRRDASPQPRALPVRLRPGAVQLHHAATRPEYAADVEALLARCRERGVAVQTIKSVARRRWQGEGSAASAGTSRCATATRSVAPCTSCSARPGLFLNSSSDATLLEHILDAASEPCRAAPADAALAADVARYAIEPLFVRGVSDTI